MEEGSKSAVSLTVRHALAALTWPQLNSCMEKTDSASHCVLCEPPGL